MTTADQAVNALATVTLLEMMFTIGLGVTPGELGRTLRDWRLVARAVAANYVLVPAAVAGLVAVFAPQPLAAAGFLIVAVCPGAPYGPPFTALAKGDRVTAVGLMAVLAGSSAFLAPLLLGGMLPVVAAGGAPLRVDAGRMVATLAVSQFLPLCGGLVVRRRYPAVADRVAPAAAGVSVVLNLAMIAAILALQFPLLRGIGPRGFLGMGAVLGASVAAGLAGAVGAPGLRRTMTVTTAVRNAGVGVVIATASFPGTAAVTATVAYALFQTVAVAAIAWGWGRVGAPAVAQSVGATLASSEGSVGSQARVADGGARLRV